MSEKEVPNEAGGKKYLPASTGVETTLDIAGFASSLVPLLGAPVSNFLSGMSAGRKIARVKEVLIGLNHDLSSFKTEAAELYLKSEEFEELLEDTLKRVYDERSEAKRMIYRAFLLNAIRLPGEDYDEQLRFLRTLEELQPVHLKIIGALTTEPDPDHGMMGSPLQTLCQRLPEMGEDQIAEQISRLNDLGIVKMSGLRTMMTGSGAQTLAHNITAYGERFVKFIQSP